MLRVLHTADWHLGKRLGRFERLPEQRQVLESLLHQADSERVDAVLVAGDVFDSANPSVEALQLFYTAAEELARGGERPVIVIAGNHDSPERLEAVARWGYPLGILLIGFPDSPLPPPGTALGRARICTSAPGILELCHPQWEYPLRLLPMPYVSAYRLSEVPSQPLSPWLRQHWGAAVSGCRTAAPTVILAHLYCRPTNGAPPEEDEAEKSIALGGSEALPASIFPETVHYVALGHIHRPTIVQPEHPLIAYAGSLLPYSFADSHHEKSAFLLELSPHGVETFAQLPLRGGYPLRHLRCQSVATALRELVHHREAYIRLELLCDHAPAAEDLHSLQQAHPRLVELRLIPRDLSPDAPPGALQEPLQTDIEELFRAFFRARKGTDPDPALCELFREVLSEHRHGLME